jgi:hypothetical protein
MPLYKIWLTDKRETKVEGDRLVIGGASHGSLPGELSPGDVGVVKGDKLVAHFRGHQVSGYQEIEEDGDFEIV